MSAFPIRLFHAILSGLVIGIILSIGSLQVMQHTVAEETGSGSGDPPGETPPPPPPSAPIDPDDLDGDGIPNDWETQYHHDPNNAADAAADFDNDGLTAKQEYELHLLKGGDAGNPLGTWALEFPSSPQEIYSNPLTPVDINNNGDLLLNQIGADYGGRLTAFVVTPDNTWIDVGPEMDYTSQFVATDFNDNRVVVGQKVLADQVTYEPYIWDSELGARPAMFNGGSASIQKINNHGDWIGYAQDPVSGSTAPAYVVDGINLHQTADWWEYLAYTDINDFGEAMGTFYDPGAATYKTFLANGQWHFTPGYASAMPYFDEGTQQWNWGSAMNSYGEFTGSTSGTRQGQYLTMAYHFDGEFHPLKMPGRSMAFFSPESLNDSNAIVGYAYDTSFNDGGFIYHDGVGLFLNELFPALGGCNSGKLNDRGQILTKGFESGITVITPDQDQDGDGMPDEWEMYYGFNPSVKDANDDADGDGINNLGEFLLRTDPHAAPIQGQNGETIDTRPGIDTDGDGIPNSWEVANGLNYNDPSDAPLDFDRDGYTNLQEYRLNTDPRGAPCYQVCELGPFPGASSASLSNPVLGDSGVAGGDDLPEAVYFVAQAENGNSNPAAWTVQRQSTAGGFSFFPVEVDSGISQSAQAVGGASLGISSNNPGDLIYWTSPYSSPTFLSGVNNDIASLYNAKLSPSGNYLTAVRYTHSGNCEAIVWKMPKYDSQQYFPTVLQTSPSEDASFDVWAVFHVNDFGYVTANGVSNGQNVILRWDASSGCEAATPTILHPPQDDTSAQVIGISNQASPLIVGNTSIDGSQSHAVVWSIDGTPFALGGTGVGGTCQVQAISPHGCVAGTYTSLGGDSLKYQPFLARYNNDSSTWGVELQGEPCDYVAVNSVNDGGEILGTIIRYAPEYKQIPALWRHGKSYLLDSTLPECSGLTLQGVFSINANGTLLATAWKNGSMRTLLLTPDRDTDDDGLPDVFENLYQFNAFAKNSPADDSDSDSLTDLNEYRYGANPRKGDTDDDGMSDGWEVSWGFLPLDPSDAALDPDNDHVTNLRESQIGTSPTGLYKIDVRLTDTELIWPTIKAVGDSGEIVCASQDHYASDTTPDGLASWTSSNDYLALSQSAMPENPFSSLPGYSSCQAHNGDWSIYSDVLAMPSYFPDSDSETINGSLLRQSSGYDGLNFTANWSFFLIPDAVTTTDEISWISWETIQTNLRAQFDAEGGALLGESEVLNPLAEDVSNSGNRRIHRSNSSGECFVLNQSGEFISKLAGLNQPKINNLGQVVSTVFIYYPFTNGDSGGSEIPEIQFYNGSSFSNIPVYDARNTRSCYWSIQSFSDDGKVLLRIGNYDEQLGWYDEYQLLDLTTGLQSHIRQPGLGNESIVSLSNKNGRLLGSGPKPFQITPDGTCIRLDALRIKDTSGNINTLGSLYPGSLAYYIASDGRITVTTTNTDNQTVILQLVPCNDGDDDGINDDMEKDFADQLKALGKSPSEWGNLYEGLQSGNLDSSVDYTGSGITLGQFAAGLLAVNTPMRAENEYRVTNTACGLPSLVTETLNGIETTSATGNLMHGWSSTGPRTPMTTSMFPDANWFITKTGQLPWENWGLSPFDEHLGGTNARVNHEITDITDNGKRIRTFSGRYEQRRIRLWGPKLVNEPIEYQYILLTERRNKAFESWTSIPVSAEIVKLKIDSGQPCSNWIELIPPLESDPNHGYFVSLVPVELISDLNNDGQITSADNPLRDAAMASGANDEIKDKGTEFIFRNDTLSNGIWDKDDTDPAKPADADDDDAEPILVDISSLPDQTQVWLEHPASAGLKYYRDRKCNQEIPLSSSQRHVVGGSVAWPTDNKLFMRAEDDGALTYPPDNPQFEGDLVLKIKVGTNGQEIETVKMKLTVVKQLGAMKYFQTVRDYIFENNTKTFTQNKSYRGGSTKYRIVGMREESTVMFGLDTYDHTADRPRLKGIDEVKANYASDVIINGNQTFHTNFIGKPFPGGMTNRCDGRLCVARNILRPPSDDTHNTNLGGPGAKYVGYTGGEPQIINGQVIVPSEYTFATGQIPEANTATPDHGIGGLTATYDRDELQIRENQAIGRGPAIEQGKGVIFTATNYAGISGDAIALAADARKSGVKPLSGGDSGMWELLFLDGSDSVGPGLTNPQGVQKTLVKGGKHAPSSINAFYYINTYLLFECEKPRN